jgi:hypothetical protein
MLASGGSHWASSSCSKSWAGRDDRRHLEAPQRHLGALGQRPVRLDVQVPRAAQLELHPRLVDDQHRLFVRADFLEPLAEGRAVRLGLVELHDAELVVNDALVEIQPAA